MKITSRPNAFRRDSDVKYGLVIRQARAQKGWPIDTMTVHPPLLAGHTPEGPFALPDDDRKGDR
jgi:hypothetical protein